MEFKVGDTVTLKTWERFVEEFGGDGDDIEIPDDDGGVTNVLHTMRQYCGNTHTIVSVSKYDNTPEAFYHIKANDQWYWSIKCFELDSVVLAVNKMKKEIYGTVC